MKNIYHYWQLSLKTRVTLITLAIFLAGIWSLAFYASHMLRKDMERLLGEQQFSAVSFVAASVNQELHDRLQSLETISKGVSPNMLGNAPSMQSYLEARPLLQSLFNGGLLVVGIDGIAIASVPLSAQRSGVNYMDRDFIADALKQGKSTIGRPVLGKKLHAPIVAMAVPVRDSHDTVVGAIVGVINLGLPNFLDKITQGRYGKSGGYVLLVPQLRLIVTATDKSRIMQSLPAKGIIPTLDRFLEGYEGSAVYVNPLGSEVLGSAKKVPVSGWLMGVTLPVKEAFAPIDDLQQRVFLATIFLTLLAGSLIWWMLRRQLLPLTTAVKAMSAMDDINYPPRPLPIFRQDEIGELLGGFNHLLETVAQREDALRESNVRSNTVIEASPVPLAINDGQGKITFLNRAFVQSLGYTLSDIPSLAEWWPRAYPDPEYRQWVADTWQKNMEEAKRSGKPFSPMEIKIQCKDGSLRTFLVSAAAFGESYAGNHLIILYDITERKKFELALLKSTELLKEAQQMAHIGSWSLDLISGELTWSDEVFRLFEIDPSQFGATYEAFLNAIHPDDRDAVSQAYANSLVTRMPYEITHRLRMSDGRIKWVHEKCMSVFDVAGKPLQSRGMVQDITDSKQVELALIAARDEAHRASQAKSEFLSSMSHELRTPMNAILGFGQLMEYDASLPAEHQSNVREILTAGYHLLELINDLLELSKIESGHIDLVLESVDVCTVAEECLSLIGAMADKRHIHLSHIGLQGAKVRADRTRLKQVLLNLFSNAIKYNREGGSVHLEVRPQGTDRVRILVTDTGIGIPAARLDEVFQPFNRLGVENGNIEGTGIGLTITRSIVEAMGGTVDVESEAGVGSTFWIELPLGDA